MDGDAGVDGGDFVVGEVEGLADGFDDFADVAVGVLGLDDEGA